MELLKLASRVELGLVAATAALAALPVGALFLFAALLLGVFCGARLGGLIAVTADLLGHGAAMVCC